MSGLIAGVLLGGVALLTAGCLGNVAKIVREVAKSDRSWCVAATGYGVNLKAGGSGVGDGDMSCSDGGLSLKSQATQVGVPLTLVPQLSIGPPTVIPPPPVPRPVPRVVPQRAPERSDLLLMHAAPADLLSIRFDDGGRRGPARTLTDADLLEILRAVGAMHGVR